MPIEEDDGRPTLLPGDEMKCKRCGCWHVVEERDPALPPSADLIVNQMLWYACPRAEGKFYAGTFGQVLDATQAARWRPGNRLT